MASFAYAYLRKARPYSGCITLYHVQKCKCCGRLHHCIVGSLKHFQAKCTRFAARKVRKNNSLQRRPDSNWDVNAVKRPDTS